MSVLPKKVLIIRFSAMGDVVLTVPVIKNFIQQYPNVEVTILTKPFFVPFFNNIPNLKVVTVDFKQKHKGITGLWRLTQTLYHEQHFDTVIDLHSVLRTWVIGFFLMLKGVKVLRINKGRDAKKKAVRTKNITLLPYTTERYYQVFQKAGFVFNFKSKQLLLANQNNEENLIKIGIAPFAAHTTKIWGTHKIYELIEKLNIHFKAEIYLFGGGKTETEKLEKIAQYYPNVHNMAGKLKLHEEIDMMSNLKAFISMDSGNMHIASLTGIPVISVWGGTHPDLGFRALYQPDENHIQIPVQELSCRPCSVFGKASCKNTELPMACMEKIETEWVIIRLKEVLSIK